MDTQHVSTDNHSRWASFVFNLKTFLLSFKRWIHNLQYPIPKLEKTDKDMPYVLAVSESTLWNPDDNSQNWILTAGKVENLRIASKRLHGLWVPAGQVFSFWKQVGWPSRSRGYVVGREIREGCVVPTVAGGLCQMSNALYDAALKSGFTILERHRHSKVIKGSLAEQNRDATVKWNYIDLRFKADVDFCIDITMSSDQLIVSFKSMQQRNPSIAVAEKDALTTSLLNDCYSCGNTSCFKHAGRADLNPTKVTTFLLGEYWIEYEQYVKSNLKKHDALLLPMHKSKLLKVSRYRWNFDAVPYKATSFTVLGNIFRSRFAKGNIFEKSIQNDRALAQAMSRYIPWQSTHLVLSQNLLPFLEKTGVLGGRTFDVLMTRLPLQNLHERLDYAHRLHPESATLSDFRINKALVLAETSALKRARRVITPHQEIAGLFQNKALQLDWHTGGVQNLKPQPNAHKVLFPASALARKGAYELRRLAKELGLTLVVLGDAQEHEGFWKDVSVEKAGNNPFEEVALIVYPAFVEHQPRFLLKAMAAKIPIIATGACGLPENEYLTLVPIGDYQRLKSAVEYKLAASSKVDVSIL